MAEAAQGTMSNNSEKNLKELSEIEPERNYMMREKLEK